MWVTKPKPVPIPKPKPMPPHEPIRTPRKPGGK